jgi:CRP/FNR family transcriptional regulator, cyclic AMP receptor protein
VRNLHQMTLQRDRGLRPLHLRDLDVDDLGLVILRLRLRHDVPRSGDGRRYCEGGDDGSDGGDALHGLLPSRDHGRTVRPGRRRVVRGRDVANVTVVTQTSPMEWPLLAGLPAEDVQQLLAIARRRTFAKGEVVFHRDDPAESLHLVVRGRFGARVLTPLGESVLVDVLGPGQSFGELALLAPDGRRSATVEALEAGETRSVFRDEFAALQSAHPGVKDVLLWLLAEQLRRSTDRLVEAHHVDAVTRVRRRLVELAATYEDGVVPLTQEDIAALAGTSRATVNRVLREEVKLGAVALARGRTSVLDVEDLERRCRRRA